MQCHQDAGHILKAAAGRVILAACLVLCTPLSAQATKPRATFQGHTSDVESLSFSPDGKTLASASDDRSIKLWDVATGRSTSTIKEERPYLWGSVAFSPDGKTLASGGWFNKVKIWEVGALKGTTLLDDRLLQCPPPRVVFSPDGRTLASGGRCLGEMTLWDMFTKKSIATLTPHKVINAEGVLAMAFTPDNMTLVSVGRPDEIKLWDVATGKNTVTLKTANDIWSAAISSDAKTVATAIHDDTTIKLYAMATGKEQTTLKGHTADVWSMVFSPDGKTLASGSRDGTIKLWELAKGQELVTLKGHADKVLSLAFQADGKVLASGSADKAIMLWDVPKAK